MFSIINLSQDASRESKYLSSTLLRQIEVTLSQGEKVLLYLNKRGSHVASVCRDCGHIWMCPNCDVSMYVHKTEKKLLCHICSESSPLPHKCSNCESTRIEFTGVGTQHIEEVLKNIFPEKRIYRFDSDALSRVSGKKEALDLLEEADIIIGTKMLTTGFNFQKVGCIAVVLVEGELQTPGYDAEEKAFQNIRQLIGRGNRLRQKTEILLQTFSPNQRLITRLTEKGMKEILQESLMERKQFNYPPYTDIAILHIRDESKEVSVKSMNTLLKKLKQQERDGIQVLYGENTFKKNKEYHTNAIIKGKGVRNYLEYIRNDILKNSRLSVQFSD